MPPGCTKRNRCGWSIAALMGALATGCAQTNLALWQPSEPPAGPQPVPPIGPSSDRPAAPERALPEVTADMQREAVQRGIARMLEMEEGAQRGEWPYEGVYRVQRQIPVGYRVGGTSIVCEAIMLAPGWETDEPRREAVERGIRFVLAAREHPLMSPDYDGGYDVRGWGYTTALSMLSVALTPHPAGENRFDDDLREQIHAAAQWYLDAIQETEIPQAGGWNYARRPGIETVSPPSSFMTAMTILALLDAQDAGFTLDEAVLQRALTFLQASRAESGEYVYSGTASQRRAGGVPGATGRMLSAEVALDRAGQGDTDRLRAALTAFETHWDELEKRRAKPGTHEPPYGVAPYYFYFAHRYAAEAVELLPEDEREDRRRRVLGLL